MHQMVRLIHRGERDRHEQMKRIVLDGNSPPEVVIHTVSLIGVIHSRRGKGFSTHFGGRDQAILVEGVLKTRVSSLATPLA